LEQQIGPIVYELNYAEAISAGVLPSFTIEHYALTLSSSERQKYIAVSREITDLRRALENSITAGVSFDSLV